MIKKIMYFGEWVGYIKDEEMVKSVLYVDNIEQRFIVQNEIEYLKRRIKKDSVEWKNKEDKYTDLLSSSKVGAVVANATVISMPLIMGISNCFKVGSFELSSLLAEFKNNLELLGIGFVAGNVMSLLPLSMRPSLAELSGYEYMCKYELDLLAQKEEELAELEKDNTNTGIPDVNGKDPNDEYFRVLDLDDSVQIKNIEDALKLRFYFGKHKKKIYESYEDGTLLEKLMEHGISEKVLEEFFQFLHQEKVKGNNQGIALRKTIY